MPILRPSPASSPQFLEAGGSSCQSVLVYSRGGAIAVDGTARTIDPQNSILLHVENGVVSAAYWVDLVSPPEKATLPITLLSGYKRDIGYGTATLNGTCKAVRADFLYTGLASLFRRYGTLQKPAIAGSAVNDNALLGDPAPDQDVTPPTMTPN